MANYNNLNIIRKSLLEVTSEATPSVVNSSIKIIIRELQKYLDKLENFYMRVESSAQEKYSVYKEADASEITTDYALYKSLKEFDGEATDILKEGYILIDEIRTFFTKEKIIYDIGFTYKGKENLYEMELSLEEILAYSTATYNTRSKLNNLYKLRMNVRKGALVEKYNELHTYIETLDDGSSTIYSSIIRYLGKDSKENKGNVYEAYKVYKAKYKSNRIPPAKWEAKEFDTILTEVKSNIAASTKGGDFQNYQIKFISTAPSLMTTSTVRTTLKEVLNIFENIARGNSSQEISEQVKKLFVKNPDLNSVAGSLEEESRQVAEDNVTNVIKSITKNIKS